jgi:hypothetical protein
MPKQAQAQEGEDEKESAPMREFVLKLGLIHNKASLSATGLGLFKTKLFKLRTNDARAVGLIPI